jgi:hypothetical protein
LAAAVVLCGCYARSLSPADRVAHHAMVVAIASQAASSDGAPLRIESSEPAGKTGAGPSGQLLKTAVTQLRNGGRKVSFISQTLNFNTGGLTDASWPTDLCKAVLQHGADGLFLMNLRVIGPDQLPPTNRTGTPRPNIRVMTSVDLEIAAQFLSCGDRRILWRDLVTRSLQITRDHGAIPSMVSNASIHFLEEDVQATTASAMRWLMKSLDGEARSVAPGRR